jgi:hypothetical protein
MKNKVFLYISLLFIASFLRAEHNKYNFFSKVIIWGHPLHSHTHSYIHWGFFKAFKHLGYEVHWVSTMKELDDIDLHNALFITEGQVDDEMPKRFDCYYILHNWDPQKYQELFSNNRCILLQVYTHDCLQYPVEKIDDYIYCYEEQKIVFIPWATDLLPKEIDHAKNNIIVNKSSKIVNWIGTIGEGFFGNIYEIENFKKACFNNNIEFRHFANVTIEQNIGLIKSSYMAPALQGPFQCEKGYIPCRIFKNISYGQWGITNNKTVYDLFKGKIVYNADPYQLFYDAQKYINNAAINDLYELMDFVKNKHTYINRIEILLLCMVKFLMIEEKNEVC